MLRRFDCLFARVKRSVKPYPMSGRIPAFADRRHQGCVFERSHGALRQVAVFFSLFGIWRLQVVDPRERAGAASRAILPSASLNRRPVIGSRHGLQSGTRLHGGEHSGSTSLIACRLPVRAALPGARPAWPIPSRRRKDTLLRTHRGCHGLRGILDTFDHPKQNIHKPGSCYAIIYTRHFLI